MREQSSPRNQSGWFACSDRPDPLSASPKDEQSGRPGAVSLSQIETARQEKVVGLMAMRQQIANRRIGKRGSASRPKRPRSFCAKPCRRPARSKPAGCSRRADRASAGAIEDRQRSGPRQGICGGRSGSPGEGGRRGTSAETARAQRAEANLAEALAELAQPRSRKPETPPGA